MTIELGYDYPANGYGDDAARYSDVFAYGNDGRGNRVGVTEDDPDYPGDGFAYLGLGRDYRDRDNRPVADGYLRVRLVIGAKYVPFPGYFG